MNNSTIKKEEEQEVDISPWLRERQKVLAETIEAIQAISSSPAWKTLEKNVFKSLSGVLQKQLAVEKDLPEMYRLQGQLGWAMKFADFSSLEEIYRKELTNVTLKLNAKN